MGKRLRLKQDEWKPRELSLREKELPINAKKNELIMSTTHQFFFGGKEYRLGYTHFPDGGKYLTFVLNDRSRKMCLTRKNINDFFELKKELAHSVYEFDLSNQDVPFVVRRAQKKYVRNFYSFIKPIMHDYEVLSQRNDGYGFGSRQRYLDEIKKEEELEKQRQDEKIRYYCESESEREQRIQKSIEDELEYREEEDYWNDYFEEAEREREEEEAFQAEMDDMYEAQRSFWEDTTPHNGWFDD